ncbi:TlpA family protein disulfide reductase [Dyadobacter psychrotolerans]|nr:TlpA disulfide reductase family protein [Dyadobacter psychrotolerans]
MSMTCYILSCGKSGDKNLYGKPVEKPEVILGSFNSYWNYTSRHVKLYREYVALDTAGKTMETGKFMEKLSSGDFLPLKRIARDSSVYYQLYRLAPSVNDEVKMVLKDWAYTQFTHYKREGKPLSGFNYTDINGKAYNSETLKGKIVVLKFWFVGCQPCVEEMPELNKLVARYKNRDDVVFLSLALDSKEKLEKFLSRVKFDYPVVADQEKYLNEELNVRQYPTHIVINKKGLVVKVVSDASKLIYILDREASKNNAI